MFFKKPLPEKCFIPDPSINLKIFYYQEDKDTCSAQNILNLINQVKFYFLKFIPDFLKDFSIEIWNHSRLDCPLKSDYFQVQKKKVIITTAFLIQDNDEANWNVQIAKALSYAFLAKCEFHKNHLVKKKWLELRTGFNTANPEETFLNDFLLLFCHQLASQKSYQSSINPETILGLRHLYCLWVPILQLSKQYKFFFYKRFVSLYRLNYIGFIYADWDWKTKKTSWNKITTQGHWTYSEYTDQFELTKNYE